MQELMLDSDFARAYTYAQRDIRGFLAEEDSQWLVAHPLEWLRALVGINKALGHQIGNERKAFESRGLDPASAEYQVGKVKLEADRRKIVEMMNTIDLRKQEVEYLIGPGPLAQHYFFGEMIWVLLIIEEQLASGAIADADHAVKVWISKLTTEVDPSDPATEALESLVNRRQHYRSDGIPKRVFATREDADTLKFGNLESYQCKLCHKWHLGNARK